MIFEFPFHCIFISLIFPYICAGTLYMHGGLEPLGGGQGLEGGVYAFDHTKRIKRLEGK